MIETEVEIRTLRAHRIDQEAVIVGGIIGIGELNADDSTTMMSVDHSLTEVEMKDEEGVGQGGVEGDDHLRHLLQKLDNRNRQGDGALDPLHPEGDEDRPPEITTKTQIDEAEGGHRRIVPTTVQFLPLPIPEIGGADDGRDDVDLLDGGTEIVEEVALQLQKHVVVLQ